MPQFVVTWYATVGYESNVTANSKEEAKQMALNNDLSMKTAYVKSCEPISATVEPA